MDLGVYARVLWRFKFLVVGGFLLAILLAILSFAKISSHGVSYRTPLTYESASTVLLTKNGFPWGSLNGSAGTQPLTGLATFYAQLASSDAVKARLHLPPGEVGAINARQIVDVSTGSYGTALPMVAVEGFSTSPAGAVDLANRAARALIGYINQKQQAAAIRPADRVVLQVMNPAVGAAVVAPRKKTLPIMIFVLVVSATLGLAFALENLRPSVRLVGGQLQDDRSSMRRPAVAEESARSKSA